MALVVGGTSGLGLSIAEKLDREKYRTFIVGRTDPNHPRLEWVGWSIGPEGLEQSVNSLLRSLPRLAIRLLVYSAGYYQEGNLASLSAREIENMVAVGLVAPALLVRAILRRQGKLSEFIAITSTSQSVPREREPVYCAVKAGLGHLAHSISLGKDVGKVLVAAPAGMRTKFWQGTDRDQSTMLDPTWVADRILEYFTLGLQYRFIRILREPARVELVEERD